MSATDPVQAVAEVIGIHDTLASIPDEGCECSCGATITTDVESYAVGLWREHQAEVYVAAARPAIEREAKAAAWDEGANAAWQRSTPEVNGLRYHWRTHGEPRNPYREADQ